LTSIILKTKASKMYISLKDVCEWLTILAKLSLTAELSLPVLYTNPCNITVSYMERMVPRKHPAQLVGFSPHLPQLRFRFLGKHGEIIPPSLWRSKWR
jgi:hypothetical protein